MFEDNEYWYVILLKGWWWTVMDEHADRAQPGMTVQMEHTTCKDPLTDDAAVISEFELSTSPYKNQTKSKKCDTGTFIEKDFN